MGSWWTPTRTSAEADENITHSPLSDLDALYLGRTFFQIPLALLGIADTSIRSGQCARVPRKFDILKQIARREEPTFVFAHFLIPHDPYVFDASGRCIPAAEERERTFEENFVGQVRYVNTKIIELVDYLTSLDPAPIIILQSDEGPYPARFSRDVDKFDWHQATDEELRMKTGILNAYFFPDADTSAVTDDATPVNSFRILFNTYFGTRFPLLPNKTYIYPGVWDLYRFQDVSDRVR
jgi:hypothetical protein